jgi:hypothetical protein
MSASAGRGAFESGWNAVQAPLEESASTMKKLAAAALLAIILVCAFYVKERITREFIHTHIPWAVLKFFYTDDNAFVKYAIPQVHGRWLNDYGVVDANDDNLLDIYTLNHNWRQTLLLADNRGRYRDVLTEWGLNQSPDFPDLELSLLSPKVDEPGLYIYWLNEELILQAHNLSTLGGGRGTLHAFLERSLPKDSAFKIETISSKPVLGELATIADTYLAFSAKNDAVMKLLQSPEYPVTVSLSDSMPLSKVFVGNKKISPKSKEFVLALRDRHAIAWADYNDDNRMDLFITRGGMGGYLRKLPESISQNVKDELLISEGAKGFKDLASEQGILKNACSGRQASWVDFDNDGLLDLFINCQDRGKVPGDYPIQLYKQLANKKLVDVAKKVGLQAPGHFMRTFKWLDVDNDGDMDLFAHQDNGFFLYINKGGRFFSQFVYRGKFEMSDVPGLKYQVQQYWRYDGQMTVTDFNGDGYLDVFVASKKGSALFANEMGSLSFRDPMSLGLPREIVVASWTDFNNDGLPDLHAVPQGLFVQTTDHKFLETKSLALPLKTYMAGIVNWFDLDNDGSRDVSMALSKNPGYSRWWEFSPKEVEDWEIITYRNIDRTNRWLQVKLVGALGNHQAIGSRVTITTPSGQQTQEVSDNDGAFFSQGHYRLYFGLGPNEKVDVLKVHWADGHVQEFKDIKSNRLLVIDRRINSN